MDFKTFLSAASTKEFWHSTQRFCFQGSAYPISFFTTLFAQAEAQHLLPVSLQKINLETLDKKNFKALLEQTILGSLTFYWFGDLDELGSDKATKELVEYLYSYQGPNIVGYFISADTKLPSKTKTNIIAIETSLDLSMFYSLSTLLGFTFDKKKTDLIKKIFTANGTLTLDAACMLMNYMELMSTKFIDEFTPYILNLVGAQPSLAHLSEHFFAKNPEAFFTVWSKIENDYPPIFWIIFWSEQVWKAYHVIKYLHEKNFVNAKKMSFRLPYSFINNTWQKHSLEHLAQAYDNLYSIDFALKRGSNFYSLDLFYFNHFMKK